MMVTITRLSHARNLERAKEIIQNIKIKCLLLYFKIFCNRNSLITTDLLYATLF